MNISNNSSRVKITLPIQTCPPIKPDGIEMRATVTPPKKSPPKPPTPPAPQARSIRQWWDDQVGKGTRFILGTVLGFKSADGTPIRP